MLPLHVGEISHTLDLLQLRSQCKGLFASDIYEIASRLHIWPPVKLQPSSNAA
jgi:hypothetical protein